MLNLCKIHINIYIYINWYIYPNGIYVSKYNLHITKWYEKILK